MKFKRYIREVDMNRRYNIQQTVSDKLTKSSELIYDDIMKLKPRISDMIEILNEVEDEYGTDSSNFLWEDWFDEWHNDGNKNDKMVCIPYNDFLFVIHGYGECVIYDKEDSWDAFTFQWEQDIKSAKELNYGEIDSKLEYNLWEKWCIFMKNFDKIEKDFYNYVQKKLNEED